mgnify:CR=1 FL=1
METFSSQIGKLETALFADLGKIAQRLDRLSDTELINMIRELNFFQELLDRGYTEAVNGLMDAYEGKLSVIAEEARKRGIGTIKGATVQQLELLQELDTRALLGNANAFANTLTEGLFSGIIAGESPSSIVTRLAETINLQTHQLNVAVHDGFRKFDDIARHKVFEGEDVRWTYVGPMDELTRDVCANTILNEPSTGYTESEASASDTPFGERGGFNCRHSWRIYESPNKIKESAFTPGKGLPKKFKDFKTTDLNKTQLKQYARLSKFRSTKRITGQQFTDGLIRILGG